MNAEKKASLEWLSRLRDVLNKEWDPIGVVPAGVQDEYDGYVGRIALMIRDGATDEALSDFLYRVETKAMALKGNRDLLPKVVAAIRALG